MRAKVMILTFAIGFSTSVVSGQDNCGAFTDVTYAAGAGPRSVAVGDLDGDLDLDLAVANKTDDDVSVLLNNGDGTFAAEVRYAAGNGAQCVAIADLDGDLDLDLAVANYVDDNVAVMLNNGDGTFPAPTVYAAGNGPWSLACEDLDGVNGPDLVVANNLSDDASVLLNNGDGTFASQVTYVVGDSPQSVAVGDLDNDLDLDLAVPNLLSDDMSILLNNGDGTFAPHVTFGVSNCPRAVAVGDLDGDLDQDLIVTDDCVESVFVLLNDGNSTFGVPVEYAVDTSPLSVAVGDLDGDLDLDLAVASHFLATITVLSNNGDGTFSTGVAHGTGNGPISVAIGDLDGDLDLDLAVANQADANVSVRLNACLPPCEQLPENCQGPSIQDCYASFGVFYVAADDFTPAHDGTNTGLCWYGSYVADPPTIDDFTVRYCAGDSHAPGAEVGVFSEASETLAVTREDTGLTFEQSHVYRYTATHDPVELQGGTCYWLEIAHGSWAWYWLLADDADGNGRFLLDGSPGVLPDGYGPEDLNVGGDLAFCLGIELSEPACGLHTVFDTGPERKVLFDGSGSGNFSLNYLGWTSGDLRPIADLPQRWAAQALTIPPVPGGGRWHISHIIPAGFTPSGYTNETFSFIFWRRTGLGVGSAPQDGDQVVEGSAPFPEVVDRVVGGQVNALFPIATDVQLDAGDYWLTVYAGNSSPGSVASGFAWFTDADNGINNLDGQGDAFMWRSAYFPDPGFAMYTLNDQTLQASTGDPNDIYNAAFIIWGTPRPCPWDCQATPDGSVGVTDFLAMLAQWGTLDTCDFDGGGVGVTDFLELLANWGPCP